MENNTRQNQVKPLSLPEELEVNQVSIGASGTGDEFTEDYERSKVSEKKVGTKVGPLY